ncbi:MAG: DUF6644 family protein [Acetobacteraceae bacterium]
MASGALVGSAAESAAMMAHVVQWLGATEASQIIQNVSWIIPLVQTIHILAISVVITAVLLVHLRNFGVVMRSQSRRALAERFLPLIWYSVCVLLVTGIILIVGEPKRELPNPVFQIKMLLLVVALALTALFERPLRADALYWDQSAAHRAGAGMISIVSLALWVGIIFAGRWIAYYNPGGY